MDNFAGGGGASLGIEWALGRSPDIAITQPAPVRATRSSTQMTEHERLSERLRARARYSGFHGGDTPSKVCDCHQCFLNRIADECAALEERVADIEAERDCWVERHTIVSKSNYKMLIEIARLEARAGVDLKDEEREAIEAAHAGMMFSAMPGKSRDKYGAIIRALLERTKERTKEPQGEQATDAT